MGITDEPLPPNSMMNFNQFNQRIANENEQNVFYRMPPHTSAPSNVMQSSAPIMMGAAPPSRGPPRFNANSNAGKQIVHRFFLDDEKSLNLRRREKNAKIQNKEKRKKKRK